MSESRILAVKIDGKLFDKLDEFVEETKITKQKYISEILSRELGQWMQQKAEQDKNLDIKHTDGQKVWDKPEVMEAIDDFMLRTGKIPKQTEFKNENGHTEQQDGRLKCLLRNICGSDTMRLELKQNRIKLK